ncbi:MAG: hypothetical protein ACRC92_25985 [Peptostreptococcaceae bacterium]
MKFERMSILFEKLTGAYYYVDKIFNEEVEIRPVSVARDGRKVSINSIETDFTVVQLTVQ